MFYVVRIYAKTNGASDCGMHKFLPPLVKIHSYINISSYNSWNLIVSFTVCFSREAPFHP